MAPNKSSKSRRSRSREKDSRKEKRSNNKSSKYKRSYPSSSRDKSQSPYKSSSRRKYSRSKSQERSRNTNETKRREQSKRVYSSSSSSSKSPSKSKSRSSSKNRSAKRSSERQIKRVYSSSSSPSQSKSKIAERLKQEQKQDRNINDEKKSEPQRKKFSLNSGTLNNILKDQIRTNIRLDSQELKNANNKLASLGMQTQARNLAEVLNMKADEIVKEQQKKFNIVCGFANCGLGFQDQKELNRHIEWHKQKQKEEQLLFGSQPTETIYQQIPKYF